MAARQTRTAQIHTPVGARLSAQTTGQELLSCSATLPHPLGRVHLAAGTTPAALVISSEVDPAPIAAVLAMRLVASKKRQPVRA